jgi:hypothetical protein
MIECGGNLGLAWDRSSPYPFGCMILAKQMLWSRRRPPEHAAAVDRLTAWTRERFKLAEDAAILVSEVACELPGCPPIETVVAFWTGNETRHQFKLFKPVAEVVLDDLPPGWMKPALVAIEGIGFECC